MGNPGLDPSTVLQLLPTLLYWIACILGGAALLGLSAYTVFLCLEIFSPQPRSKARPARVTHPVGCAPAAEENLDLSAAETPILAEAVGRGEEAVQVPALPHDAQVAMTLLRATLESEPAGPRDSLRFLRSRRAVVPSEAPVEFEG